VYGRVRSCMFVNGSVRVRLVMHVCVVENARACSCMRSCLLGYAVVLLSVFLGV